MFHLYNRPKIFFREETSLVFKSLITISEWSQTIRILWQQHTHTVKYMIWCSNISNSKGNHTISCSSITSYNFLEEMSVISSCLIALVRAFASFLFSPVPQINLTISRSHCFFQQSQNRKQLSIQFLVQWVLFKIFCCGLSVQILRLFHPLYIEMNVKPKSLLAFFFFF